uniref:Defensin 1 n=1 Tax=Lasioderma serricorne TaxID=295660 RepID=A0A8A4XFB9_9COLE|nr:defensin 1 [Lasioderma serricorne]
MNKLAIVLLLTYAFAMVSSLPVADQKEEMPIPVFYIDSPKNPKITCDLLSIEIWGLAFNDSLCAANCLLHGHKGGHCESGVCNCRD